MVCVGADIVDIDEVAQALAMFGERYVQRVFTRGEVEMCGAVAPAARAAWLAQCFAAKEAGLKLLRSLGAEVPDPGRDPSSLIADGVVDWRWMEVTRCRSGCFELHLGGQAKEAARSAGVSRVMVSLTTSGHQAMAVALAWPSSTSGFAPGGEGGQIVDPGAGPDPGAGADPAGTAGYDDGERNSFDRRQDP